MSILSASYHTNYVAFSSVIYYFVYNINHKYVFLQAQYSAQQIGIVVLLTRLELVLLGNWFDIVLDTGKLRLLLTPSKNSWRLVLESRYQMVEVVGRDGKVEIFTIEQAVWTNKNQHHYHTTHCHIFINKLLLEPRSNINMFLETSFKKQNWETNWFIQIPFQMWYTFKQKKASNLKWKKKSLIFKCLWVKKLITFSGKNKY